VTIYFEGQNGLGLEKGQIHAKLKGDRINLVAYICVPCIINDRSIINHIFIFFFTFLYIWTTFSTIELSVKPSRVNLFVVLTEVDL
jgi:hypothetical protein